MDKQAEFEIGSELIYSLHGKCKVTSIEPRVIQGKSIYFYKLELQKSSSSRINTTRTDSAIWLPIQSAKDRGLRRPLSSTQVEECFNILSSREYYFNLSESWRPIYPKLEETIRLEGALGLAKAMSFLFILKKKQVVPHSEVLRFSEIVSKFLLRELAEATGLSLKALDEQVHKLLKQKLLPDH